MRREHAVTRWRLPAELAPELLTLVANASREHIGLVPEAAQHLRELRRVAERVGDVRDARRAAERSRDPQPLLQVAHDRLARDEEQIGEDVPRADEQPVRAHERLDPRPIGRLDREMVLERDGLPVERERPEARLALEQIEERADHRHESSPEALEALVPLAIPVGVRNQGDPH